MLVRQCLCFFLQPSVSLQVKRKLDLDSDHQYLSTTRPSIGQAPPSTPAPPRGTHTAYSADFFSHCYSKFTAEATRQHGTLTFATAAIVIKTAVLLSAQTTACQPVFVFTRVTSVRNNKDYWSAKMAKDSF